MVSPDGAKKVPTDLFTAARAGYAQKKREEVRRFICDVTVADMSTGMTVSVRL